MTPFEPALVVVAQGQPGLLAEVARALGDVPGIRVIEDRRQDRTLLPREGRDGRVFAGR